MLIVFSCKSKTLDNLCLADKINWGRNIYMCVFFCVCEHVGDLLSKIHKIGFESNLPCTPATDTTTIVLNKPQTVSPTTMQLPFLMPPEMWYFSGKRMILRISQRILRGNGRHHNDLVLVLFRAMFTSNLFSDFFAYHQRRKSFPCYSLLKENILLSNFWTRMMFVHSILDLVLSTKVCWKCSTGIFLRQSQGIFTTCLRNAGITQLCGCLCSAVEKVQSIPSVSNWDNMAWNHVFWKQPPPFEDQKGKYVISSH